MIEDRTFYDCTSLTSIVIPPSVRTIGGRAFEECTNLTSIVILPSVTMIGGRAFYACTSLTSIVIPPSVTMIGDSAFRGCTSLASIVIPSSVTRIEVSAFGLCTSLTSIVIPPSVGSIGGSAFYGCTSLTSIVIPPSVGAIGRSAFRGCTNLQTIICSEEMEQTLKGRTDLGLNFNQKQFYRENVLYHMAYRALHPQTQPPHYQLALMPREMGSDSLDSRRLSYHSPLTPHGFTTVFSQKVRTVLYSADRIRRLAASPQAHLNDLPPELWHLILQFVSGVNSQRNLINLYHGVVSRHPRLRASEPQDDTLPPLPPLPRCTSCNTDLNPGQQHNSYCQQCCDTSFAPD
jgi:hypothetical protein